MWKALIVEDEAMLRQGMAQGVDWASMGVGAVYEAADGEEGLEKIRALAPDVIVTDIKMPRMDGLAMLARARAEGCRAAAVILTSYGEFEFARQALRLGSVDYLLKPVDERALLGALARVRAGEGAAPATDGRAPLADWAALMRAARRQNAYVAHALAEISERYAEHVSIEALADELGVSASYLSRKFKEVTEQTFGALLAARRIEASIRLLQDGCRVGEAAGRTGFHDYKNFCVVFKKFLHKTPMEFLRGLGRR